MHLSLNVSAEKQYGSADIREVEALRQRLEMYELIFESIHYGSLVTDEKGYITHFNKPYGLFLNFDPLVQIGKHCTEVIENSRMHIVAKRANRNSATASASKARTWSCTASPSRKTAR